MSQTPKIPLDYCEPDQPWVWRARVANENDTDITQASVSSIAYTVTDMADASVVDSGSFVVSTSIFDTLQTGQGWNTAKYPDGWNARFHWTVAQSPGDGETYKYQVTITPSSGEVIPFVRFRRASDSTEAPE